MIQEVNFYQFTSTPLAKVVAQLADKIYQSGARAIVLCKNQAEMKEIDDVIWTFSSKAFVPHGTENDLSPELQPIYLATNLNTNPNKAEILVIANYDENMVGLPEGPGGKVKFFEEVLGEQQLKPAECLDVFEDCKQGSTTKLPKKRLLEQGHKGFKKVIEIFDGNSQATKNVIITRAAAYNKLGVNKIQYWAQTPEGKWQAQMDII